MKLPTKNEKDRWKNSVSGSFLFCRGLERNQLKAVRKDVFNGLLGLTLLWVQLIHDEQVTIKQQIGAQKLEQDKSPVSHK